jgi:DNA-binding transcriptional LysR family regulator
MDRLWQRAAIESNILGEEKYVVIESTKLGNRAPTFLDNDPEDMATEFFFYQQKRDRPIYRRGFFHDCYGILDAVSEGLGSAVMPQHLIRGRRDIKVSDAYKPVKVPVVLYNYKQAFTTKLQRAVVAELRRSSPKFLAIKDGH